MPQRSPCICRTAACFCSAGGQRDHRAPLPWLQIHTWIRIRGSFHVPDMEPLSCPPCWEAAVPVLLSPPASLIQCFSLMDACPLRRCSCLGHILKHEFMSIQMLTFTSVQTRAGGQKGLRIRLFVSTCARQKPSAITGMTALWKENQKAAVKCSGISTA